MISAEFLNLRLFCCWSSHLSRARFPSSWPFQPALAPGRTPGGGGADVGPQRWHLDSVRDVQRGGRQGASWLGGWKTCRTTPLPSVVCCGQLVFLFSFARLSSVQQIERFAINGAGLPPSRVHCLFCQITQSSCPAIIQCLGLCQHARLPSFSVFFCFLVFSLLV